MWIWNDLRRAYMRYCSHDPIVIGFCVSATIYAAAITIIDVNPSDEGTAKAASNFLRY